MAFLRFPTPRACPICGAPHTTCKGTSGPIMAVQLPARDAASARSFSTATYRGPKPKPQKALPKK